MAVAQQLASANGGICKDIIEFDHITARMKGLVYRRFPFEVFWRLIARPAWQTLAGAWDTANWYGMQKLAKLDAALARLKHHNVESVGYPCRPINRVVKDATPGHLSSIHPPRVGEGNSSSAPFFQSTA